MASSRRRDWVGVLAVILGSVLLLLGGLFVLVYVVGLVTGDSEVTGNVSGFAIVMGLTVGPGILLVRRSRLATSFAGHESAESNRG
jgi:hypothetical protein